MMKRTFSLPIPNITSTNAVICVGATRNYSTPNVVRNTYLWSSTGSPTITNGNTNVASMVWANAANYVVTLIETITATGCQRTTTFNVLVNPLPQKNNKSNIFLVCCFFFVILPKYNLHILLYNSYDNHLYV